MFDYDPIITSTGKSEIITNIINSFSSMYLTMISIVQGVAVSLLVLKVSSEMSWSSIFGLTWNLQIIVSTVSSLAYILTTFLFIILTWHSYFWLAAIARWVPTIWDSILFFVLGAFEFMLINSVLKVDSYEWFYIFTVIGFVSVIQYKYNSKRLDDDKTKSFKNNLFISRIWEEKADGLGRHIATYKRDRSRGLLIKSVIFLVVIFAIDFLIPASILAITWHAVTIKVFIKCLLILAVLFVHIKLVFDHVQTQKETLSYLVI